MHVQAGWFDSLFGGGRGGAGKGKAAEIVEELLTVSRRAGGNPRQAVKEEIEELATQLRKYRGRAPTRDPLFYGDYEVVFTSNPNATGGPLLTSAPGKIFFAGQKPRQSLLQEGLLVNTVEYKTLGILPGTVRQEGTLSIVNGNTYEVFLESRAVNRGEPIKRRFEVVYLDERVRVVQFIPEEEDRETSLFIFERIADEAEIEEEEGEDDQPAKRGWLPLGGTQKVSVKAPAAQEEQEEEAKPAKRGWLPLGGTQKVSLRQQPPAAEEANQLEALAEAARSSQEQSKAAARQLKELEKAAAGTSKNAAPARAALDRAQQEAESVESQLQAALKAAQEADERYKQAASELRDAEKASR